MRPEFDFRPFGNKVRFLRTARHMTIRDLAQRTGMSHGHLSRLERGIRPPRSRDLVALADELDVTSEFLLEGVRQSQNEPKKRTCRKGLVLQQVLFYRS